MTQKDDPSTTVDNSKYRDGVNRNARLIVRNISFKATEDALRAHFEPYGTVEEVKLLKRPDGKLVGCGFVHFTHVPMANKAIAATNKKEFLGRPVTVAWAVQKDKYAENLQDTQGKRTFNKPDGDGFKNRNFKKESPQETAETKEEKNKIRINRNARLVVRNVSFKATEESLKEHFAPYGELLEVKLLKKPDGKLVGCAFVHFKNVPMAKKALLNTNMKPFLGRPISVDWAVAKNKYMQHVIEQQMELQDQVKKEESDDSSDEGPPINISGDALKEEVKSESDDEDQDAKSEDDDSGSDDDKDDDDEDDEDEDDDDEVDMEEDNESVTSAPAERQRIKLNDAEDGCTVFVTNIPFSVDDDRLRAHAEATGPVRYALVCVDKLTEHSKGSGFVKFLNKEDADKYLSLPASEMRLEGQVMQAKPALRRENLSAGSKKQAKDNRNLYLVKEGVVVAGTKAAVGVSASDMAKRLALERSKTQMLKNLNRFVSRYRLVVSNLPAHYDDSKLRRVCVQNSSRTAKITECRVMRDLRAPPMKDGRHPSKGYGFVMFMKHEDALACLRKMNNNPDVFDRNNRPIVSFSIEDRTALNARKKRLEKSIANNPAANKEQDTGDDTKKPRNRKRKNKLEKPDESKVKRGKYNQDGGQNGDDATPGKFVKPTHQQEYGEFAGLTAKVGTQHKMRSNHKLKVQADVHRENVKKEKKASKYALKLKMAAKERVKQPKQKVNKNPQKGRSGFDEKVVHKVVKESSNFSDLVTKYKTKLAGNSLEKVKAKWYES